MKIYLLFLLATTVTCRPNEENRQASEDPGFQATNDVEGIVYLDGGSAHARKSIGRSPYIGKDVAANGKTKELNNYSYVRRKADPTTSSITPIAQLPFETYPNNKVDVVEPVQKYATGRSNSPGSLRINDRSYGEESNYESASRSGGPNGEYADRSSNTDQETNGLNDVRRYGQESNFNGADTLNQANNNNLELTVPVVREDVLFTGIDGLSQGTPPRKTHQLDNLEPIVRAGPNPLNNNVYLFNRLSGISQPNQRETENTQINRNAPNLTNENNSDPSPVRGLSSKYSSVKIVAPTFNNTSGNNAKVTSYTVSTAHRGNTNRSTTDMHPNMAGRFQIPFPIVIKNQKYMARQCHCVNINGHRSCTCDHEHNCDTLCQGIAEEPLDNFGHHYKSIIKGIAQTPMANFGHFASIFKGVTEAPTANFDNFETIFKGFTEPPKAKFGHFESIIGVTEPPKSKLDRIVSTFKGVTEAPTSKFDHFETIFKGVTEPPTANFNNFETIFKGVTEPPTANFNNFETIFKGVTEPPTANFNNFETIFKGVTKRPTANFDHLETIVKGVTEPPTANFDIYKEHTTPMPILTKPMKIHHSIQYYPSNKPTCNCGCGCCSCGCNCCNCGCGSHNQHKEYYYNEDMEHNENYGGYEDAENYPHEDITGSLTGAEFHPMTQSLGWSGMFGGGGGLVPYVQPPSIGSSIGVLPPNIDINSSEESKGIFGLGSENGFSSGSYIPGGSGAIVKSGYGYGGGYGSGSTGDFSNFFGSGGFKGYLAKLFARDAVPDSKKKVYTKHVSSIYHI